MASSFALLLAACNNDKVAGVSTGKTDSASNTTNANVTYAYLVAFSKF